MEKYERGIFLPRDKCRLVVWIERELRRNDIFFFFTFFTFIYSIGGLDLLGC